MKTPKRKLKDKLEKIVKSIVKIRDKNICQKCLKKVEGANCHASHVIPVSRDGRLAYDPINLKVLCFHCHINWWHKHPLESGEWYFKSFPDRAKYLQAKHIDNKEKGSISLNWYKENIELYKEILDTMV